MQCMPVKPFFHPHLLISLSLHRHPFYIIPLRFRFIRYKKQHYKDRWGQSRLLKPKRESKLFAVWCAFVLASDFLASFRHKIKRDKQIVEHRTVRLVVHVMHGGNLYCICIEWKRIHPGGKNMDPICIRCRYISYLRSQTKRFYFIQVSIYTSGLTLTGRFLRRNTEI